MFGISDFIETGKIVDSILDKFVSDKSERERLRADLNTIFLTEETKVLEKAADNVKAEIEGDSWLQRNWRPILMLSVVLIIVNNYILFPYLSIFTDKVVILELPHDLFNLLTIGVGGYVVGRSVEKGIKTWKK